MGSAVAASSPARTQRPRVLSVALPLALDCLIKALSNFSRIGVHQPLPSCLMSTTTVLRPSPCQTARQSRCLMTLCAGRQAPSLSPVVQPWITKQGRSVLSCAMVSSGSLIATSPLMTTMCRLKTRQAASGHQPLTAVTRDSRAHSLASATTRLWPTTAALLGM